MGATADDRKEYSKIIDKLDALFNTRRNIIFERARFNRRNQQTKETAEQYIMALHDLVATCNYGAMESEMIRDRLVVGIRDSALSAQLQLKADPTLEQAKKSHYPARGGASAATYSQGRLDSNQHRRSSP